jgi:hypothetical protein
MNAIHTPDDHLPGGERFVDAALSEHARLGRDGRDDELIHRILLETVNRRPAIPRDIALRQIQWRPWLAAGSAAAAALVALGFVTLSTPGPERQKRPSEELHFTVRYLENSPTVPQSVASAEAPQLAAKAYPGPVSLKSPALATDFSPALTLANYELITTLGPSIDSLPAADRHENFRITADESLTSAERRLYFGKVVIEHSLYRIEASEVSVPVAGRTLAVDASPLLAGNVTVTQESPRRVAHAKSLRFDPISGSVVLSGVDSFETDGGKLGRFAPDDQLVLHGESFSVESARPVKYASPPNVTR